MIIPPAARTSLDALLDDGWLDKDCQIGAKYFLKCWRHNNWMRNHPDWRQAMALMFSSPIAWDELNLRRIVYCSRKGLLCGVARACYRCSLDKLVEPTLWQFRGSFDRAPYWSAITASVEVQAAESAITYIEDYARRNDPEAISRHTPLSDLDDLPGITSWAEHAPGFEAIASILLSSWKALSEIDVRGGFAVLHFSPSFFRGSSDEDLYWLDAHHVLQPHVHFIINSSRPLTQEALHSVYWTVGFEFARQLEPPRYFPDVWGAPLSTAEDLARALAYPLRPWPIAKWWRQARRVSPDPESLHSLFDQVVFHNLKVLGGYVQSPRRFGNMNSLGTTFIGSPLPKPVPANVVSRYLRSNAYAAAHPELEESVMRYLWKQELRQGRQQFIPDHGEEL